VSPNPYDAAPRRTGQLVTGWPPIPFEPVAEREKTASLLAVAVIGLLGGSIALHYIAIMIFGADQVRQQALSSLFNSWLPVIAGLAGSAATYYFTRDKK